jgi:hypothetical protein
MSDTYRPITLASLAGAPPTAATPGGFWNPLQQFAASAVRSGTSELVGLPGEWAANVFGTTAEENDAWRNRNFWTSIGSQLVGAVPAYLGSAAVTGPLAVGTGLTRAVPAIGRLYGDDAVRAAAYAAAPVRTTALEATLATVPISAARLAVTPMLGGDLERTAASVGIDLAGSAVLGGGFGLLRGMRSGNVLETEQLLARQVPEYNIAAPPQERLQALEGFNPQTPDLATLRDRTVEALRQTVRIENAPSLAGRNPWLAGLEGMEDTGEKATRAMRLDLNRLFRPTPATTEGGAERALRVQTLTRSGTGFDSDTAWRSIVDEVGLPQDWERNIQYPRVVTARESAAAQVEANLRRHLEDVGEGWFIRREQNQDLFLVARELERMGDARRWFVARTNAPERLRPLSPALRRGDKLARFIGQAEETLLERAAGAMPEGSILRMAVESQKSRPVAMRQNIATWSMADYFPQPLARIAKELTPLKDEVWRRTKSVIAPTMHRFKDRPLISWTIQNAKHIYETAQGKAARALHGRRPGTSPINQIMRGLPDEGGLRSMFDKIQEPDVATIARYASVRETGKLSLDDALRAVSADVDAASLDRVTPLIREWDRVANEAWQELVQTAQVTGTKLGREVEGWAIPHMWPGDFRQRVLTDDRRTVIFGGRTKGEARTEAEQWVRQNGGRLNGETFQTDRKGDYELLLEGRARRVAPSEAGVNRPGNLENRQRNPAGGYIGDENRKLPSKSELWDILASDITMKYQSVAERAINRLTQPMLPEIRGRYGRDSLNEAVKQLRVMRGEEGEFSRWQNKVMSVLDPLFGKNSATKIAAAWNATEAHFAFGFGNLSFPAGNAVTFLQTVAPKLALMRQLGRNTPDTAWNYFDFQPSFNSQGLPDGAFASISPMKLMRQAAQALWKPTDAERVAFGRAVEEGVIAARIQDEYLGVKSRFMQSWRDAKKGEEPITNLLRAGATANMALPHRVEELTRAHAFMTWHKVGKELMNMTDESAYIFAKRGTWQTMYGYSQSDRPRAFTGPVGMMAGLFKNWMFNYTADLAKYAGEATRGNMNGLLWALGGVTATAGVGGIPLVAAVDQFQRMFNNKSLVEELYGVAGIEAGDVINYGLPALFNVSIQGMMAAPFNDPRRDLTFLTNVMALQRAQRVTSVAGDIWDRWAAGGENPFTQDRTWDQLHFALSPRTLYRLFAQVEDGALKSIRNGRPIIEGVGGFERVMNAIGLTSTRIARAWDVSSSLWDDQARRRELTTNFAEAYSNAMTAGDARAMQNVIQRAIENGSDLSSVMRGAMMRQRNLMLPQLPMDYLRLPGAYDRMRTLGLIEQ